MKKLMNKDNNVLAKRNWPNRALVSWLTIAMFLTTNLAVPSHASALPPQTLSSLEPQTIAQQFRIPDELGRIESLRIGNSPEKPFVVILQDAHAILDAQQKIRLIIEHVRKEYGIQTVALEGAAGKLDTILFRAFPDAKSKQEVFGQYLERGEVTGAA